MELTGSTASNCSSSRTIPHKVQNVIREAALHNQGWNPHVALLPPVEPVELSYMKYVISGAALLKLLN
jgi:hypothetical protein